MNHALVLVAIAGCGGNSSTPPDAAAALDARPIDAPSTATTTVSGMIGGATFDPMDAVSNTVTASGFDYNGTSTDLTITNFANECSLQGAHNGTPNGRFILLDLAITDAAGNSAPATSTGMYTVFAGTPAVSSKLVEAYFEIDDSSCLKSSSEFATSGTVMVTSATTPMQASFDLAFPSGHITGTYHAAACPALDPNSTPIGGCSL